MFYMYILPLNISEEKWAEVWDMTLELIRNWNLPLIRPGYRKLSGIPVPVFTDPEDGEDGYWEIFGEDRWGTTAGNFGLYRDLGRYLRWGSEAIQKHPLLPDDPSGRRQYVATPFEHKQRGRPYVIALIAVGMLIEDVFADDAVIHGDFDWNDVLLATEQLERIFGKTFPPPRVTKEAWVRARYADEYEGEALCEVVNSLTVHPTKEPIRRTFYATAYYGRKTFTETPKFVRERCRLAGELAKDLPSGHKFLLRQLAENMLLNHVRVRASVVESVLPSLDAEELKWLVGLTDRKLSSSKFDPWRGPLIEDEEARNRIKRAVETEDASGTESKKTT